MTIKQLTEIVNGSLTPSSQKLDADLLEISTVSGNALQVTEDGLTIDISQLATKTELATAIAGIETGGDTSEPAWELTNATLVEGVLTYTGGTFEDEGGTGTITGLFAKKSLKVGESVTIDYALTMDEEGLYFAVDNGIKVGSNSDIGALFAKDMNMVRLVAGRDWPDPYTAEDGLTYKATIQRVNTDRVALTFKDQFDNILVSRDVYIQGADLKRVWILSSIAGFSTTITSTQSDYATVSALDLKVDKEAGKGLSTNDFTTELKEKLILSKTITVDEYNGSISTVSVREQGDFLHYQIDTPSVGRQMRTNPKEFMSPSKVNSVPLYSLDNDGEFVLTEPDSWVSFNDSNFVFPVYHLSTIDNTFLKGIVTLSVEMGADGEGNQTLDFNYTHNVKDVIDGYELYINPTSLSLDTTKFTHVFTSSVEGETVFGTIKVPLTYEESEYSLQQAINDFENNGFSLRYELVLKSGSKRTVMVRTIGITQRSPS